MCVCVCVCCLCGSLGGWGGREISPEQFVLCSMTGRLVSTGAATSVCGCFLWVPTIMWMRRAKEEMLFGNYIEVPPVVTEYLMKGLLSPGQDSFKHHDISSCWQVREKWERGAQAQYPLC